MGILLLMAHANNLKEWDGITFEHKFHIHQCQAQSEVWPSTGFYLTFMPSFDITLTFTYNPYQILIRIFETPPELDHW